MPFVARVPQSWEIKNIERIVYMADLRYCRIKIVPAFWQN